MTGRKRGIPYSEGEAEAALSQLRDVYHREIFGWLLRELRQTAELRDLWKVAAYRFELSDDGGPFEPAYRALMKAMAADPTDKPLWHRPKDSDEPLAEIWAEE